MQSTERNTAGQPSHAVSYEGLAGRIMWGFASGVLVGVLARLLARWWPGLDPTLQWLATEVLDPAGQVFLRLLFFVVVPLVFSTLALGVLQLESAHRLGSMAARTFLLFSVNMAIGVAIGLTMMNVFRPGATLEPEKREQLVSEFQSQTVEVETRAQEQGRPGLGLVVEMFLPRNLLKSVVEFQLLPLILFALLVGLAGGTLPEREKAWVQNGLEAISQLMARMVRFALLLAPYGVGALMAAVLMKLGLDFLRVLAFFVAVALAGMALHLFGTVPLLLKLLSKRSPFEFFKAMRVVLATGFSTSSSSATLPTTMHVCRTELGVSAPTAGFVIPLGATMNMAGTALFEGCVVLFVAQVYGIELPLLKQIALVLLAVVSAVAVAGIPGGSLPVIMAMLTSFGLPGEGIALVLGVDRILDMARTTLNVAADAMTACVVDEQVSRQPGSPP